MFAILLERQEDGSVECSMRSRSALRRRDENALSACDLVRSGRRTSFARPLSVIGIASARGKSFQNSQTYGVVGFDIILPTRFYSGLPGGRPLAVSRCRLLVFCKKAHGKQTVVSGIGIHSRGD